MKCTVGIVDIGLGNINSVVNMINYLGFDAELLKSKSDFKKVQKIVLPGVGSFDQGIQNLHKSDLFILLQDEYAKGTPLMGICLGMQLLGMSSEEGSLPGLGLIDSVTKKFPEQDVVIPHMGWNTITMDPDKEKVFFVSQKTKEPRYYFVHSYYMYCNDKKDVLMTSQYGNTCFVSAINRNNLYGFQFHPEKSHKFGMEIFRGFLAI
ncbi:imidazole glycerol phosphate synthase subunit HisH [Shewanella algae]|uniref:imidazole glycerol phosphate synthase subunit HisH n=1 Tax=Shewanella algae TaxID=38313 RepID=UPI001AAFB9A4|nr:imidazole glycerol phosphate synthase subunit HisH [Shewanella algae]MBO2581706.1 imidazole glycerol phosphate synthase subunit HisH [Shewanella algae]